MRWFLDRAAFLLAVFVLCGLVSGWFLPATYSLAMSFALGQIALAVVVGIYEAKRLYAPSIPAADGMHRPSMLWALHIAEGKEGNLIVVLIGLAIVGLVSGLMIFGVFIGSNVETRYRGNGEAAFFHTCTYAYFTGRQELVYPSTVFESEAQAQVQSCPPTAPAGAPLMSAFHNL